jgi:uncharacterized protein (TIGR01777 family)
MKILMTGATGWIGKNLGLELVRRGHTLVCPVRNIKKAKAECPFPAEWIHWPKADQDFILSAGTTTEAASSASSKGPVEAAINLAGEPVAGAAWTDEVKSRIKGSRVGATQTLVKKVKEYKIPVLVSASATGFYGDRKDELLNEDSQPGGDFLAGVCQQWENEALNAPKETRTVILRIGIVLGKDGGALQKMTGPFRAGVGGPLAGGKQWMS